jgi:hypothetical protein
MLYLAKLVYVGYPILIMKMHTKSLKSEVDLKNLNALCNVELILGLPCILPLLECVHTVIKVTQSINVFVCDFGESIKLTQ